MQTADKVGDRWTITFSSERIRRTVRERKPGRWSPRPGQVLRHHEHGAERCRCNGPELDAVHAWNDLLVHAPGWREEQHPARRDEPRGRHRDVGHRSSDYTRHRSPHQRPDRVQRPLRRRPWHLLRPSGTKPGPVCDAGSGDTGAAYNAYPKDVLNCGPPSYAFEANSTTEFGDKVTLDATASALNSMNVDFKSYGCGDSGNWNTADCDNPWWLEPGHLHRPRPDHGEDLPRERPDDADRHVVAQHRPNPVPALIDTRHELPEQPACAALNSRFMNPTPGCASTPRTVLTFNFSAGTTLTSGQGTVWTVSFNTTHYGNPHRSAKLHRASAFRRLRVRLAQRRNQELHERAVRDGTRPRGH